MMKTTKLRGITEIEAFNAIDGDFIYRWIDDVEPLASVVQYFYGHKPSNTRIKSCRAVARKMLKELRK